MSSAQLPLFVVLEGLDGVGKSTLVRLLAQRLAAIELRTPPHALAGVRPEILRYFSESPMATTLYYAATVADASRRVAGLQAAGRAVVMDRYFLSTYVYGTVVRAAEHPKEVLDALALRLVPADVTVYLHAERDCRRQRMTERGHIGHEDQLTFEPSAVARIDAGYRALGEHRLAGRFLPIDTTHLGAAETLWRIEQALMSWNLWIPPASRASGVGAPEAR